LFEEGSETRIMLTHTGLEAFPQYNPEFACGNFAEGWNAIVGESLKNFVER
jgi:hypothetical protein